MEMQNQNPWGKLLLRLISIIIDELSDYDNMLDENQLEPDYYIDRPVIYYI